MADHRRTLDETQANLAFGRCRVCGHDFFPPQYYGCEFCGAHGDALTAVEVPALGCITALATVHTHPTQPTPFTIGEIRLDGPRVVVQALLDAGASVGDHVRGRVEDTTTGQRFVFTRTTGAR